MCFARLMRLHEASAAGPANPVGKIQSHPFSAWTVLKGCMGASCRAIELPCPPLAQPLILQCCSSPECVMNLLRGQGCHAALPPPQARSLEGLEVLPLSSNGAKAASIEYSLRQPDLSSVQVGAPPSAAPLSTPCAGVRCHHPAREHDWRQHMSQEHVGWSPICKVLLARGPALAAGDAGPHE